MSVDLDRKWLKDFAHRLSTIDSKLIRISLNQLWGIFAEVFAHRPDTAHRRLWLLKCLEYAECENIIRFPKTKTEILGNPPLPKYVTRILEPAAPKNTWWKTHYWHHKLQWIAALNTLAEDYHQFLRNVDKGLKQKWFQQQAPLNRRSVELTGKEKRLKKLLSSDLFIRNGLNRSLLNVSSDVTPLAYAFVGKKPIAIVFENREPFNVALSVLTSLSDSPYGILVYGGGNCFVDSVADFLRIQKLADYQVHIGSPLEKIHYVGDLDWAGLSIAHRINLKVPQHKLPSLMPAPGIHKAILDSLHDFRIRHPDGFPNEKAKNSISDPSLIEWLPKETRNEVLRILTLDNRIPEEMLTAEALLQIWQSN